MGFPAFHFVIIGSMIAVVVVLFAYSYFVWRADPEKESPAGTQPADDE